MWKFRCHRNARFSIFAAHGEFCLRKGTEACLGFPQQRADLKWKINTSIWYNYLLDQYTYITREHLFELMPAYQWRVSSSSSTYIFFHRFVHQVYRTLTFCEFLGLFTILTCGKKPTWHSADAKRDQHGNGDSKQRKPERRKAEDHAPAVCRAVECSDVSSFGVFSIKLQNILKVVRHTCNYEYVTVETCKISTISPFDK